MRGCLIRPRCAPPRPRQPPRRAFWQCARRTSTAPRCAARPRRPDGQRLWARCAPPAGRCAARSRRVRAPLPRCKKDISAPERAKDLLTLAASFTLLSSSLFVAASRRFLSRRLLVGSSRAAPVRADRRAALSHAGVGERAAPGAPRAGRLAQCLGPRPATGRRGRRRRRRLWLGAHRPRR